MKYKLLHKSISVFIAFIVVLSTMSFSIEKHFCGTHLVDVAIFSKVKKCGMEMNVEAPMEKKCCKNEVEIVKGQDDLKTTAFDDLTFNQQLVLTALVYSYVNLFESLPKQIIPHKDYSPPNLIVDTQLLDNVFLI